MAGLDKELEEYYSKAENKGSTCLVPRMKELQNMWQAQQPDNTDIIGQMITENQESLSKIKETNKQFLGQRRKDCDRYDKELKGNLQVIQSAQEEYRIFMSTYSKKTVEQRNTFEDLRVEKMRTLQNHYKEYNERLGHLFQLYNEQETWFYQQERQMVSKIDKSIINRYQEQEVMATSDNEARAAIRRTYSSSLERHSREKYVDPLVDQKMVLQRLDIQSLIQSVSKEMGLVSQDTFQSKHKLDTHNIDQTDDRLKDQKSFSTARLGQKSGEDDDDIPPEDEDQFIGYTPSQP